MRRPRPSPPLPARVSLTPLQPEGRGQRRSGDPGRRSSLHPVLAFSAGRERGRRAGTGWGSGLTARTLAPGALDIITCRWDPADAQPERPERPGATMAAGARAPAWRAQPRAAEGVLAPPLP